LCLCRRHRFPHLPRLVTHGGSIKIEPILETRGWTLQEMLFSPRLLHFTASKLGWECRSQNRCKCQINPDSFSRTKNLPPGMFSSLSTRNPRETQKLWRALVMDFTKRRLTFQADRLLAVSGLAAAMEQCTSGTYMFGVWKQDLTRHLLWARIGDGEYERPSISLALRQFLGRSYALSWSWAPIPEPVEYLLTVDREHF
jgi:hypothetical protein